MGARGQSATSQAADAVLTVDRIDRLGEVIAVARRTRRVALQSVLAGMAMSLAAMGVAAVGLLPAVWGALLQEVIDVAVILNALRALRPGATATRLAPEDAALTSRFRDEHEVIRADIEELRATADSLGFADPGTALARAQRAYRLLADEIEPHEQAEERELYPALDRVLGSPEATATMSRAHAEISRQSRRLGQLLADIGAGPPDEADIADLRAMLYGLHAVLRLHTATEDESYLSLAAENEDQLVPHSEASRPS
jgi:iron-sulfur cluster repair protein YtfE (RIC family)